MSRQRLNWSKVLRKNQTSFSIKNEKEFLAQDKAAKWLAKAETRKNKPAKKYK